jgi:hypothetical protein
LWVSVEATGTSRSLIGPIDNFSAAYPLSPDDPAFGVELGALLVPAFDLCLLTVMVELAECLPVVAIPEQLFVTLMWNDVIDYLGGSEVSVSLAEDTQGMCPQEHCTGFAPPTAIATLSACLLFCAP